MIRVQREDFDTGAEIRRLIGTKTNIGGVVSFIGLVRDFTGGASVGAITLEHYPAMTARELAKVEAEAQRRWPLDASLIVHRIGRLEPGDQIVLVVAASAHRQAAFEACHFLIDWLKTKAASAPETSAGRAGSVPAARAWIR